MNQYQTIPPIYVSVLDTEKELDHKIAQIKNEKPRKHLFIQILFTIVIPTLIWLFAMWLKDVEIRQLKIHIKVVEEDRDWWKDFNKKAMADKDDIIDKWEKLAKKQNELRFRANSDAEEDLVPMNDFHARLKEILNRQKAFNELMEKWK